jgi:hypothetical protein
MSIIESNPGLAGRDIAPPAASRLLVETLDLAEAVPVAGPPAILIVVPLVLLALMVAGPFVVVLTLAAVLVLLAVAVALAGVVLASPYLLVQRLRRRAAA